jgi:hypothetical protein
MTVVLTSPVMGQAVGSNYTGPEEAWLLANGYASQAGYTGPGVANTGAASSTPANDLTKAENREPSPELSAVGDTGLPDPGKLDPAMTFATTDDDPTDPASDPAYDFDPNSVNNDAPSAFTVSPANGLAAGGTAVTLEGQNFEGVTGVTFGGTAATSVVVVSDTEITCVAPAHAAGAVDVVATNPTGSKTEVGAFTYA